MREEQSSLKDLSLFYLSLEWTQFLDDGYEIHRTNVGKNRVEMKGRKKMNTLYFGYFSDSNITNDLKSWYQSFEQKLLPPHTAIFLKTGVFMVTIIKNSQILWPFL